MLQCFARLEVKPWPGLVPNRIKKRPQNAAASEIRISALF